jgi:hypothetical protein
MRPAFIIIPFALVVHLGAGARKARGEEAIAPRFDDVEVHENAAATYKANEYEIVHVGSTSQPNEDGSWWRPVRGNYRLSIDHDVFFTSLGRPDLAAQYRSRRAFGRTLEVSGYMTAVAGVIVTPFSIYKGSLVGTLVGAGMLLGGVIARSVGTDMQKPTFPESDALDMAARYNDALRTHLGLGAAVSVGGRF